MSNKATAKQLARLLNLTVWQVEHTLEKKQCYPVNLGGYGLGRGKARMWDAKEAIQVIGQALKEGSIHAKRKRNRKEIFDVED